MKREHRIGGEAAKVAVRGFLREASRDVRRGSPEIESWTGVACTLEESVVLRWPLFSPLEVLRWGAEGFRLVSVKRREQSSRHNCSCLQA